MGEDKAIQALGRAIDRSYKTGVVFRNLHRDSKNDKPKASQEGFLNYLVMFRKNME